MLTGRFWRAAGERALRTFAQALLGALGAGLVLTDAAQWRAALITAAGATLASVLTSIVASNVGDSESPALVEE